VTASSVLMPDVLELLRASEYHRDWGWEEYSHLIIPAIENDRFLLIIQDDKPQAFCTWTFLTPEQEGWYLGYHGLDRDAFTTDHGSGTFWAIDFTAPYDNCSEMVNAVREHWKDRYGPGLPVKIFRPAKNRVGMIYTAR